MTTQLPRSRYIEDKTRTYVGGKRVRLGNPKHPLHAYYKKYGMHKCFEKMLLDNLRKVPQINEKALNTYNEESKGDVYIMSNPAWKGWYKVGMAIDATDRAREYQTYTPFADFTVLFKKRFYDRRVAEKVIHDKLQDLPRRGEWFQGTLAEIKKVIKKTPQKVMVRS